jgi:Family of unknown function (DUF6339)
VAACPCRTTRRAIIGLMGFPFARVFCLRDMEDRRGMRPAIGGRRCIGVGRVNIRLALASDKRHDPNAVLTAPDAAAECLPSVEREYVLARFDIGFRDTLGHKAFKDRGIVQHALAGASVCQRFGLHFSFSHDDCSERLHDAPASDGMRHSMFASAGTVYLTHTRLLEYARKRWPIPTDNAVAAAHVRTHFFAKEHRQIERDNAGSRLWWIAHLCRRVKGLELRDSLNVLLYRADVRASIIERPTVSQSANLFSAVIEKLRQSFEGKKKLFERASFRRLMREINSVGGAQLLDAMSEEQIGELIDVLVTQKLGLSEL